jgi:peroxiredoxin
MRLLFTLFFLSSIASFAQTTLNLEMEGETSGNKFLRVIHGDNGFDLWGKEKYKFSHENGQKGPKKLELLYVSNGGKILQEGTFWIEDQEYFLTGNVSEGASWALLPVHPFTQITDSIAQSVGIEKKELILRHLSTLVGLEQLNAYKSEFTDEELVAALELVPENLRKVWEYDEIQTYLTLNQSTRAKIGLPAPDFSLESKSGEQFVLSEQKGKYVLLEFSFTGCRGCILALPELKKLHEELGSQIQIVSLWRDRTREVWLNSQAEHKSQITWTNVWDPNAFAASLFDIEIWPTYVLIDPEGRVQSQWSSWYKKGNFLTKKIQREIAL